MNTFCLLSWEEYFHLCSIWCTVGALMNNDCINFMSIYVSVGFYILVQITFICHAQIQIVSTNWLLRNYCDFFHERYMTVFFYCIYQSGSSGCSTTVTHLFPPYPGDERLAVICLLQLCICIRTYSAEFLCITERIVHVDFLLQRTIRYAK